MSHQRSAPIWYVLVAVMVSTLATAGGGIWYTRHVQREADHRWCEVLTILTDGQSPTSDRGRVVAAALAELRRSLGCP